MISDNPTKKVIRYSLRHGGKTEVVREATPGRRKVEFVNHNGFSDIKPAVRLVKGDPVRIERSKSTYLNSKPTENVVRTVLPPQKEGVRILRGTQQPVITHNGSYFMKSSDLYYVFSVFGVYLCIFSIIKFLIPLYKLKYNKKIR